MAKKKEKVQYAQLTELELKKELGSATQNLYKIRFRASTTPLKNPMEIRKIRREIARLKTFLNIKAASISSSVESNFNNGRAKS